MDESGIATAPTGPIPAGPDEGIARLTAIESELAQIEGALTRLDDGTYGLCAVCGCGLWGDRLDQDPLVTLCLEHADLVNGA
jgi:RNA polymerase-binding transcription factor DksA